jgi:DNA ligase-1
VRKHTVERYGPVRVVEPFHVFEIGFEAIARSTRHRAGVAVRFPRILRWRTDKPFAQADTLDTLAALLPREPVQSSQRESTPHAKREAKAKSDTNAKGQLSLFKE